MSRSNQRIDLAKGILPPNEALHDLIPGYLGRRRQDLEQMRYLLSLSNYSAIAEMAHKIKGNGSSYGFEKLSLCAGELQRAAEIKNKIEVEQAIQSLEAILNELEKM